MTEWGQDSVDAQVPGYFKFTEKHVGEFRFGTICCDLDWWELMRPDSQSRVEFLFKGTDGIHECSGRGWAVVGGDMFDGMVFFDLGDEAGFTAKRAKG